MNRKLLTALALGALTLFAPGCPQEGGAGTGNGGDAGSVKLAFAGPLTGEASSLGVASKMGAELAIAERNAAGGIDGKQVELVVEDDKGLAAEATNVAQKIAGDTGICMVIGHFNSSCTLASRDTYNRIGLVQFSPGSTNVTVCRDAPFTFRNLYHDNYQGDLMARYAKEQLGFTKAAVAFDNDDYGRPLKETIVAKAKEIGLEITAEVAYSRGQTQDYKTLATTLQASGPQIVIISGLNESASLIAKAIRNDLGWKDVAILGSDGVMHPDFVKNAGDAAEGAYVVTPFFFSAEASPEARAFGEAFRKKYGQDPDTWAGLAYDAANMAMQGIAEAGADRKKLQEWFTSRRDKATGFKGVTGWTWFDEHGDCYSKPAQIVVVRNGGFALAEKQIASE